MRRQLINHILYTIFHSCQKGLMPFAGNPRNNMPQSLPFKLSDYIELVELTGRMIRSDSEVYKKQHTAHFATAKHLTRKRVDTHHQY